MKIAIAAEKNNENSKISEVSGRAKYYLIYDNNKLVKTIKNPFAMGGGGAGYGVAKMIGDEGVDLIIAGHFGNNIILALEEKGIKYKEVQNKVIKEIMGEIKNE